MTSRGLVLIASAKGSLQPDKLQRYPELRLAQLHSVADIRAAGMAP